MVPAHDRPAYAGASTTVSATAAHTSGYRIRTSVDRGAAAGLVPPHADHHHASEHPSQQPAVRTHELAPRRGYVPVCAERAPEHKAGGVQYPDSTRMHSRPTLNAVNTASESHVVTSGLRAGGSAVRYNADQTRMRGGWDAAPRDVPLANTTTAGSRFLVGTRGYTRTSAWPPRAVGLASPSKVWANTSL